MSTFTRIPWVGVEARRNILNNPSGRVNLTGYAAIVLHGTLGITANVATHLGTTTTGRAAGSTGILIQTMSVGTELLPNTTYSFSVEVYAEVLPGSPRDTMVLVAGPGVVSTASRVDSQGTFTRRTVTFTTAASGNVAFQVANGAVTVTGTNYVYFRDAIVEKASTVDAGFIYFNGDSPDIPDVTFYWTGPANNSPSIMSIPAAADQITPLRVLAPYRVAQEARTVARSLLESTEVRVAFIPPKARANTMKLLFADVAAAYAALAFFQTNHTYVFDDPEMPQIAQTFVVADGQLLVEAAADGLDEWALSVPWVSAS